MNPLGSSSMRRFPAPLLAFGVPLVVYLTTLAPSLTLEDSGEYIAVANTLGLAHPPGAPLWCLLAHGMTRIPLGAIAQRTNFLSALAGALASLFLFLWVRRRTGRWDVALSAAGVAAFSRCIWGQSVVTEIYTLNLMFLFLCLWLVERWRETGKPTWLAGAALAGGLGACNHHLLILLSPVVIVWAFWRRLKEAATPRVLAACTGCLCLGLSVYLYLPIRSAQSPPIEWQQVDSLSAFFSYLSRNVYKTAEGGLWYSGTLHDAFSFMLAFVRHLPHEQGGLLVLFAIPGLMALRRRNVPLLTILGGIILLNVPILQFLGRSPFTPTSEYINRLYYLPATAALAVFTATGWEAGLRWTYNRLGRQPDPMAAAALILMAPLFPLALNWSACDRSEYLIAEEYQDNLVRSLPSGGAVFPLTNNEGFLLLYARYVENDPRAWLLDERFGWDGREMPRCVYTAWSVGKSSPHPLRLLLPEFKEVETFPETLLYRILKEPLGEGLSRFRYVRKVDYVIRKRPEDFPDISPFERMIFASYSAYYAGLGARYFLEEKREAAEEAWARAEDLNPEDSYCTFLLGTVYQEAGVLSRKELRGYFEKALECFDVCYDPLDTRFYAVTKEMIQERLASLETSNPG